MEQLPADADARAAPSASKPNDTVMDIHASPKHPRESAQGNMVSQSATSTASVLPESQSVTTVMTVLLHRAPARACQSLAHHTTKNLYYKSDREPPWPPRNDKSTCATPKPFPCIRGWGGKGHALQDEVGVGAHQALRLELAVSQLACVIPKYNGIKHQLSRRARQHCPSPGKSSPVKRRSGDDLAQLAVGECP
eukprot:scaffold7993_cov110-Isochrysis_galbana.AAC.1